MVKERKVTKMATQIASTPTVRESEACKIFVEVNRNSSDKAKKGAKKLASIFEKMLK